MSAIRQAAQVSDGVAARALLVANPHPSVVRAVACRADVLRVDDSKAALELATAALEAQAVLPLALRRPRLMVLTWCVFASTCRAETRFEEAEYALNRAASLVPPSDTRARAEVARRFADLRAEQRRGDEARALMADVLAYWRSFGGRELGKRLCTFGAILIRLNAYSEAVPHLEEALTLLAPNGDRFHFAVLFNLAVSRTELSSGRSELKAAQRLLAEASPLVEPGSLLKLRCHWLAGKLVWRLGDLDEGLLKIEGARPGIEERGNPLDRALLLLDLTDLHLERSDPDAAREVALSSFGIMAALRNEPEALRAIKALHRAAQALSLDRTTVRSVRRSLLASRP